MATKKTRVPNRSRRNTLALVRKPGLRHGTLKGEWIKRPEDILEQAIKALQELRDNPLKVKSFPIIERKPIKLSSKKAAKADAKTLKAVGKGKVRRRSSNL